MTLTIHLPPEKEAVFKAEAQLRGLSVEQWLVEVADQHVQPAGSIAHCRKPIRKNGPAGSTSG